MQRKIDITKIDIEALKRIYCANYCEHKCDTMDRGCEFIDDLYIALAVIRANIKRKEDGK